MIQADPVTTTIAAAPGSGLAQGVAVARAAAQRRSEPDVLRQEAAQRREQPDRRQASSRRPDGPPVAREAPRPAAFRFEYADNTRVMKLQDSKGILIYQIPSKGQLALLKAEEAAASQVDTTA